jgi:hypothetical protein
MFAFPPHQANTAHKSLLLTEIVCASSVERSLELKVKNSLASLCRAQPNRAFESGRAEEQRVLGLPPQRRAAQRER